MRFLWVPEVLGLFTNIYFHILSVTIREVLLHPDELRCGHVVFLWPVNGCYGCRFQSEVLRDTIRIVTCSIASPTVIGSVSEARLSHQHKGQQCANSQFSVETNKPLF